MTETADSNQEKQNQRFTEKNKKRTRIFAYVIILLNVVIAIVTNIATNAIPTSLTPYLQYSWLILGILVIVYIFIEAGFNADQKTHGTSIKGKRLAQRAIREAKYSILGKEQSGLLFRLISVPYYIDTIRYKKDLQRRISKFKQVAENYNMAIQEIDSLVTNGKLSSDVAVFAKNLLSKEFVNTFGKNLPSRTQKVNDESN